jgi:glycosyltransferase involved in cell wall biosynthesis
MEASAMGLPVVATDIRGCRQVVVDGTTGTLVPVDDAPALAAALGTLVDDAFLRARQGMAAAARAGTHFDDRRVVKTTLGVYEDLMAHSMPAHANALA